MQFLKMGQVYRIDRRPGRPAMPESGRVDDLVVGDVDLDVWGNI